MASGRLFLPGWMPARDSNGDPIPNVSVSFYQNETDVLASVYADDALTVPLTNPVAANSSGRFPQIYASDAITYSASVEAPYGPAGQPFTFDGLEASQAADIAAANLAQGAAEDAEAAQAAAEAAAAIAENAVVFSLFRVDYPQSILRTVKDRFNQLPLSVREWSNLVVGGDWSPAFNAAFATGRNVYVPQGDYLVKNAITLASAGQLLIGDGVMASRILIDTGFNMAAAGVLVIPNTADEYHAGVHNVGLVFTQPDSLSRAAYTQYPYAIYAQDASRIFIGDVRVSGGWLGFDLRGNTGGLLGGHWELGCLSEAVTSGGALDFWTIDNIHLWPFGFTGANQVQVYRDGNTGGVRIGRIDGLGIGKLSSFACRNIIEATGGLPAFGNIGTLQLDGAHSRLEMSAGNISVGSGYGTTDFNETKISVATGASLQCGPFPLSGLNTATLPLVYVGGAYASFSGGLIQGLSPNAPAYTVEGGYMHVNDMSVVGIGNQTRTRGVIRQISGVLSAHDNVFDNVGSGFGPAIEVATNAQNSVTDNSFGGWGLTLPTSADIGSYWPNANVAPTTQRRLAELTNTFLGVRRVNVVDVYRGLSDAAGAAALQAIAQSMVDSEIELYQPSNDVRAVPQTIATNGWLNCNLEGVWAYTGGDAPAFEFTIDRDTTKKYFKAKALTNQTTGGAAHTAASAGLSIKSTDNTKFCTYNDFDLKTNGFYSSLKTDLATFTTSFGQESTWAWNTGRIIALNGVKNAKHGWLALKGSGTGNSLRDCESLLMLSGARFISFGAGAYVCGDVLLQGHFGGVGAVVGSDGGSQYRSNIILTGQADAGLTKVWDMAAGEEWSYLNDQGLLIGGGLQSNWPSVQSSKLRGRQVQVLEDAVIFNTDATTLQNLNLFRFTNKANVGRGAGTLVEVHFSGLIGGVAYGEFRGSYLLGNNGTTTTVTAVGTAVNTFGGGFVVSMNVSGLATTLNATFTPSGTGTFLDCNIVARDGRVFVEPLI